MNQSTQQQTNGGEKGQGGGRTPSPGKQESSKECELQAIPSDLTKGHIRIK